MRKHYRAWKEDRTDRHCHPIFTCIDGCGTGKSRLLDEFPRLLQEELVYPPDCEDKESMQAMLRDALVFKISFSREEVYWPVTSTVGSRMLYQLQDAHEWSFFSRFTERHMTPEHALSLLSQQLEKPRDEMCVILCVDDLQCLAQGTYNGSQMDDMEDGEELFLKTMSSLSLLVNESKCWVTVICASTSFTPMYEYQVRTSQWRVDVPTRSLTHPMVNGVSIFDEFSMEDPRLMDVLIDDMGGFPRVLAQLYHILDSKSKSHNTSTFVFRSVYDFVVQDFQVKYRMDGPQLASMRLAFLAVLRCDSVAHLSRFGDLVLDEVLACSLMRVQSDRLVCPYMLYVLLESSRWDLSEKYLPRAERIDRTPWMTWQEFNIKFRVLKSLAWGVVNDPYLRWGKSARRSAVW
ncbi:hypothetical protein Poli38472_001393 [Pythium oligandrum]|uniref:Uncharacterized protein n=1 Tax=Pythium oligandrum TaxID=41045 RepID=A0A8K1CUR9_PYTOL|nr:hypothetical protein Poli38472_001393 [Pythium oligandrum]|eukprot:TMW69237.1 hypothetical protein Poli38472_001393 [Pythium oligandrum]